MKITLVMLLLCAGLCSCRKADSEKKKTAEPSSTTAVPAETDKGKVLMTDADRQRAYYFRLGTKADAGDTEAQRELGTRYLTGEGLKMSAEKGLYWLHRSAAGNNKAAQYALAQILATADDTEKNAPAAIMWMTKAADNGLADAQRDLAAWYMEGKLVPTDWKKAEMYLDKAANAGDADSQYILGEMYISGAAVDKDMVKAREWISKAAAQDHPRAKQRLEFLDKGE